MKQKKLYVLLTKSTRNGDHVVIRQSKGRDIKSRRRGRRKNVSSQRDAIRLLPLLFCARMLAFANDGTVYMKGWRAQSYGLRFLGIPLRYERSFGKRTKRKEENERGRNGKADQKQGRRSL